MPRSVTSHVGSLLLCFLLLGSLLAAFPVLAARAKPEACPPGRFLVTTVPGPFTGGASPAVLELAGAESVDLSGCGFAPARIRAKRKTTTVTAKWAACGEFTKVRLVAKIASPACDTAAVKLRGKKRQKSKVTATRSTCGDGRIDTEGGEACDASAAGGDAGCPGRCGMAGAGDACTCATTTTTTTTTTSTTTTTTTTTTTSTTTTTLLECPSDFASCTAYEDHTSDVMPVVIDFDFSFYAPKCVRIRSGQTVTFVGPVGDPNPFGTHPLRAASCAPSGVSETGTGSPTEVSFTLTELGVHGYYCTAHGSDAGAGMAGSIVVDP